MAQEIYRIAVKANFRSRTEAAAFIASVKTYFDPKVKAEIAFGCSVECEANERYRKDLKRKDLKTAAEIAELK